MFITVIQIDTTTLGRYHDTMGDVENPSVQSQDVPTRDGGIITKFVSRFITDLAPHGMITMLTLAFL